MKAVSLFGRATIFCCTLGIVAAAEPLPSSQDDIQAKALVMLRKALAEEKGIVKVHAAEALLALSYGEDVVPTFQNELALHGNKPLYRTQIWQVLARATHDREAKSHYIDRLRQVYFDRNSPDRVYALEALAQLRYVIPAQDRLQFVNLPLPDSTDAEACLRWLLAASRDATDVQTLASLLDSLDPTVRGMAAYALRHFVHELPNNVVEKLIQVANCEPESKSRIYVIGSAFVAVRNDDGSQRFKGLLLPYATAGNAQEKYDLASVLAMRGTSDDLSLLYDLLSDPDPDVRVSAANAVLRISRRRPIPFSLLDWFVLAGYGIGMMAIGWYYSRAKDVDEYLLGGRKMNSWAVGISLYATLMSSLTYLSLPGEIISHGPLFLCVVFSYPLVYLVVGRFIIPFIMSLRVTSAYEILEMRLGLSVRMLGSIFFLLLRLMWMSLIVYATSSEILVPLLRLNASATPWVCLTMAAVTVAYTSVGGFRAVVVTDVVQTGIMLAGALLSLMLIAQNLGSVTAWWPANWSSHWDRPTLFDPNARISAGIAVFSQFTWYVCTVGSDQMAIQRYLATRDVRSARRMFGVSMVLATFVVLLLAALGLALLAFYRADPSMLPDGTDLTSGADKLLPHFIVYVLPPGVSALIVAGVLSSAMDSLSSGVNASCSVITVDWIDRFRRTQLDGQARVREAKIISWGVGLAVVLLSLFASFVPGNLLEKCFTVANLLVTPLFVLFFMAMFIPWATAAGTWLGSFAALTMAVAVAHGEFLGLSFIWIMPTSLVTGIVAGCLGSLLPIGCARPMLETRG